MSLPQYTPYKDALTNAMTNISELSNSVFIGQQIIKNISLSSLF